MSVYIISLKFAPGLKKEFQLLGEELRSRGHSVGYLLSEKYISLGEERPNTKYFVEHGGVAGLIRDFLSRFLLKDFVNIFAASEPSFVLFYNPHPLNPLIARLVKLRFPSAIVGLFLHDPFKKDKAPYGLMRGAIYWVVERIQSMTLKWVDLVLSPSKYSQDLFLKRYPRCSGVNKVVPLIVPDSRVKAVPRIWFSMVGNAHSATGHDKFVELVNHASELPDKFGFALISSSNIDGFVSRLTPAGLRSLCITNRPIISDSEIGNVISRSIAVFRLDSDVTQSGVVPVSYMHATPIIAVDLPGLTQHVRHGETGYILPKDYTVQDLVSAMRFVSENFTRLSANSRALYESYWAPENWDAHYSFLLKMLHM